MDTKNNTILTFDLDDTLYKEIDFLKSAYKEIAIRLSKETAVHYEIILANMLLYYKSGLNAFSEIINTYNITTYGVDDFISIYRNHKPQISLNKPVENMLFRLKQMVFKVGVITDGRSVQQRNKIEALGLSDYFDDIIISEEFGSEKPNVANYTYFENQYGDAMDYIYVGDNTQKDFLAPNALGWHTICLLDDGHNIHKQSFELEKSKLPKQCITDVLDLEFTINQVKHKL